MTQPQRNDADSPWKLVLRTYFREAIEFYFAAIASHIDWSIPPEFLDKEFVQITPDAEIGKRYADQLVRVQRKHEQPLILILHLEVQAQKEKHFTARMFIYAIRIFELFHQPATSLAILCDANPNWRPSQHTLTSLGTDIHFNFTAVKLLDYATQWEALEASQNPFAVVTMAHLKTQETKKAPKLRQQWKFQLVRRLYEQGYNRSEIINLFKFIDWVMVLPKPQKSEFWSNLKTYEEERQMPYITSVEEIGYERGREEGEQRGREEGEQRGRESERRSLALKLIRRGISLEAIAEDTELSLEELQQLQTQLEP
jgi:predicted transposase/invertase (TIGR01784 family)